MLAVGTLFITLPAKAGKSVFTAKFSECYQLSFPSIDPPEPKASGMCTLQWVGIEPPVAVAVSCRGLTPGNQYCVVVHYAWTEIRYSNEGILGYWEYETVGELPFTADARGRLNTEFTSGASARDIRGLWIENDAGEVVLGAELQ